MARPTRLVTDMARSTRLVIMKGFLLPVTYFVNKNVYALWGKPTWLDRLG